MKRLKKIVTIMVVALLMLTGCSTISEPIEEDNIDLQQKESEDKMPHQIDSNEENADSVQNIQEVGESIYGKVKSIIGNEVEIELGSVPDWDGGNGDEDDDDDKKKQGVPMVKVVVKENPPGFENFYAPDPSNPIYGEDGEINLKYTGKSKIFIIQAGTEIRNTLGKTASLEEIKKGSILMLTPKVIDGKDAGIEMLTILG